MIVAGSGELLNASEVLTRKQLDRLQKAGKSDHTQYIIEPAEAAGQDSRPIHKGTLTWKFNYKSALGLVLAREYILGADRFDYAFREYIRQWAYRRPTPNDFFRLMNNAAGEDLNWFWNACYCQTWTLDQGVKSVTYVENDPAKGSQITLVNNRQMVMPVKLRITEQNGQIRNIRLPVEVWQQGGECYLATLSPLPLLRSPFFGFRYALCPMRYALRS